MLKAAKMVQKVGTTWKCANFQVPLLTVLISEHKSVHHAVNPNPNTMSSIKCPFLERSESTRKKLRGNITEIRNRSLYAGRTTAIESLAAG